MTRHGDEIDIILAGRINDGADRHSGSYSGFGFYFFPCKFLGNFFEIGFDLVLLAVKVFFTKLLKSFSLNSMNAPSTPAAKVYSTDIRKITVASYRPASYSTWGRILSARLEPSSGTKIFLYMVLLLFIMIHGLAQKLAWHAII